MINAVPLDHNIVDVYIVKEIGETHTLVNQMEVSRYLKHSS